MPQPDPIPDFETDAFIDETRHGYSVIVDGRLIEDDLPSEDAACAFLYEWTQAQNYYPETWSRNDRGNVELLIRDEATRSYVDGHVGWV